MSEIALVETGVARSPDSAEVLAAYAKLLPRGAENRHRPILEEVTIGEGGRSFDTNPEIAELTLAARADAFRRRQFASASRFGHATAFRVAGDPRNAPKTAITRSDRAGSPRTHADRRAGRAGIGTPPTWSSGGS